jgi:small-conductance mechanosensitive channel
VGDYVQVAGQAGVVRSLNTRATVLVTLEGKHIRIPNAIIYKEILINSTASPSVRGSFDMIIPYEVSTVSAVDAVTAALRAHEGLLPEPPPRALVEELRADGVRLKAYFWFPSQGVDGFKILSDARLRAKVALQQAGISPPSTGVTLTLAGRVPVDLVETNGQTTPKAAAPTVTPQQAKANLIHDSRAAAAASGDSPDGHATPEQHVLSEAGSTVSDEGENLIGNHS